MQPFFQKVRCEISIDRHLSTPIPRKATGSGVQHEVHSPNCCCVQAPSLSKWQNVRSSIIERALIGELGSDMLGRFEEKDEELDESKVLTTQLICAVCEQLN